MHATTNTFGNTSPLDKTYDSAGLAGTPFRDGSQALARSKDDLVNEFQKLISEGEALLKSTTSLSGEALAQAREKFRDTLKDAKTQVDALSEAARAGGRRAVGATEEYVRENPWPAIGMAAGVGFLIGALSFRR